MTEGQIYGEHASEEAMAAVNPNFVVKLRAIYEVVHAQAAARQEAAAAESQLQAIVDENNAGCASYAPRRTILRPGRTTTARRHHFHRGSHVHR